MSGTYRALTELAALIQPGDLLTLFNGATFPAVSHAANPCEFMKRERAGLKNAIRYALYMDAWIVAVQTDSGCQMPVNLRAIQRVERRGVVVWDITMPVQLELM